METTYSAYSDCPCDCVFMSYLIVAIVGLSTIAFLLYVWERKSYQEYYLVETKNNELSVVCSKTLKDYLDADNVNKIVRKLKETT